jgi:hypothetical protein
VYSYYVYIYIFVMYCVSCYVYVQSLSQKGANQFQNFKLKKLSAGADGAKVSFPTLQQYNTMQ